MIHYGSCKFDGRGAVIMSWVRRMFAKDETRKKQTAVPDADAEKSQPEQAAASDAARQSKGGADSAAGASPETGAQPQLSAQEEKTFAARDQFWDQIGFTDDDLISYAVNPQFMGAPSWPNTRQTYRIVRTGDSLIIASDGLSDPFPTSDGRSENCGYEMEVFIEIPGWQNRSFEQIQNSWAFSAVELFAQNTAGSGGFLSQLEKHGVMSMELPLSRGPVGWAGESGNIGALIDVPLAPGMNLIKGLPGGRPARIVPLTLIQPKELQICIKGGGRARKLLANDLVAAGVGHRTPVNRDSLR